MFHQYNTFMYNVSQYNADAFKWVVLCSESISSTDARIGNPTKVLADTVTSTDVRVMDANRLFTESVLATDTIVKSISNKGLSETVRVNDWLQVKRKNDSPNWGN